MQRRKEKEKRKEEQDKYRSGSRLKHSKKNEDDHLDPMDPAAYSDVSRYINYDLETGPTNLWLQPPKISNFDLLY